MSAEKVKIALRSVEMKQTLDPDEWHLELSLRGDQNTLFSMIEEIRNLLKDIDAARKE